MALVVWNVAGARSYVSVADADTYFSLRLNASAWTGAVTATKEAALATATMLLDTNGWIGTKSVEDQPLGWPRTGTTYDDDVLPPPVVLATQELALALLNSPALADLEGTGKNIQSLSAGSVSVTFFQRTEGTIFPRNILRILDGLTASSGANFGGTEVFGNCDESAFPATAGRVNRGF